MAWTKNMNIEELCKQKKEFDKQEQRQKAIERDVYDYVSSEIEGYEMLPKGKEYIAWVGKKSRLKHTIPILRFAGSQNGDIGMKIIEFPYTYIDKDKKTQSSKMVVMSFKDKKTADDVIEVMNEMARQGYEKWSEDNKDKNKDKKKK